MSKFLFPNHISLLFEYPVILFSFFSMFCLENMKKAVPLHCI